MKNEKHFKTWGDFAKKYDLVLFNKCIELNDGVVLDEWLENHTCNGDVDEFEQLRKDDKDFANQYGADDFNDWCKENCECTVYQWYAIAISEFDQKYLNETYNLDIFYSDTLDLYILPVYHFGTGWDYVNI